MNDTEVSRGCRALDRRSPTSHPQRFARRLARWGLLKASWARSSPGRAPSAPLVGRRETLVSGELRALALHQPARLTAACLQVAGGRPARNGPPVGPSAAPASYAALAPALQLLPLHCSLACVPAGLQNHQPDGDVSRARQPAAGPSSRLVPATSPLPCAHRRSAPPLPAGSSGRRPMRRRQRLLCRQTRSLISPSCRWVLGGSHRGVWGGGGSTASGSGRQGRPGRARGQPWAGRRSAGSRNVTQRGQAGEQAAARLLSSCPRPAAPLSSPPLHLPRSCWRQRRRG